MADAIKDALVSMGRRVRVYTPYGQLLPGMAYLVRRLLENTANDSFLRASFTEHVPEEQLLMNPLEKAERNGSNGCGKVSDAGCGKVSDLATGTDRRSHGADGDLRSAGWHGQGTVPQHDPQTVAPFRN